MTTSSQPDDTAVSGAAFPPTDERPGTAPAPTTIRTPDQRLRGFVSATLDEMAPERAAAKQEITQLRLTPVRFELGARPYPPRALYRAYLARSDVFIGIYWQRYGWVAPGINASGLEGEYQLSGERPRLIYIKTPAPEGEPRLQAPRDRIRDEDVASYRCFSNADELREIIADDLALPRRKYRCRTHRRSASNIGEPRG